MRSHKNIIIIRTYIVKRESGIELVRVGSRCWASEWRQFRVLCEHVLRDRFMRALGHSYSAVRLSASCKCLYVQKTPDTVIISAI